MESGGKGFLKMVLVAYGASLCQGKERNFGKEMEPSTVNVLEWERCGRISQSRDGEHLTSVFNQFHLSQPHICSADVSIWSRHMKSSWDTMWTSKLSSDQVETWTLTCKEQQSPSAWRWSDELQSWRDTWLSHWACAHLSRWPALASLLIYQAQWLT